MDTLIQRFFRPKQILFFYDRLIALKAFCWINQWYHSNNYSVVCNEFILRNIHIFKGNTRIGHDTIRIIIRTVFCYIKIDSQHVFNHKRKMLLDFLWNTAHIMFSHVHEEFFLPTKTWCILFTSLTDVMRKKYIKIMLFDLTRCLVKLIFQS